MKEGHAICEYGMCQRDALAAELAAAKNLLVCTLDGVSPWLREQIVEFTKENEGGK